MRSFYIVTSVSQRCYKHLQFDGKTLSKNSCREHLRNSQTPGKVSSANLPWTVVHQLQFLSLQWFVSAYLVSLERDVTAWVCPRRRAMLTRPDCGFWWLQCREPNFDRSISGWSEREKLVVHPTKPLLDGIPAYLVLLASESVGFYNAVWKLWTCECGLFIGFNWIWRLCSVDI